MGHVKYLHYSEENTMAVSGPNDNNAFTSTDKQQMTFVAACAAAGALCGLGGIFIHAWLPLFLYGSVAVAVARLYSSSAEWENITEDHPPHDPFQHKTAYIVAAASTVGLAIIMRWFPWLNIATAAIAGAAVSGY